MPIVHQTHSCRFALVCGYIFHKVQEFMWKPSRSTGAAYERLGDAGWLLLGAEGSSKQATVAAAGWLTPTHSMGSLPLLLVESDSLGPIFFAPDLLFLTLISKIEVCFWPPCWNSSPRNFLLLQFQHCPLLGPSLGRSHWVMRLPIVAEI